MASTGAVLGIVGGSVVVLGVGAYFAFRNPYPASYNYPSVARQPSVNPNVAAAARATTVGPRNASLSVGGMVDGLLKKNEAAMGAIANRYVPGSGALVQQGAAALDKIGIGAVAKGLGSIGGSISSWF